MDTATSYGVGFIIEIIIVFFNEFAPSCIDLQSDVIDVQAPFSDECCQASWFIVNKDSMVTISLIKDKVSWVWGNESC